MEREYRMNYSPPSTKSAFQVSPTELTHTVGWIMLPRLPETTSASRMIDRKLVAQGEASIANLRETTDSPTPLLENCHPAKIAAVRIIHGLRDRDGTAQYQQPSAKTRKSPATHGLPTSKKSPLPTRRAIYNFQPSTGTLNNVSRDSTKRNESLSPDSSFHNIMSGSLSSNDSSSYKTIAEILRKQERQKRAAAAAVAGGMRANQPPSSPSNPIRDFVRKSFRLGRTLTECIHASTEFYGLECHDTYERRADDDILFPRTRRSGEVQEEEEEEEEDEDEDDINKYTSTEKAGTEPGNAVARPPGLVSRRTDPLFEEEKQSELVTDMSRSVLPKSVTIRVLADKGYQDDISGLAIERRDRTAEATYGGYAPDGDWIRQTNVGVPSARTVSGSEHLACLTTNADTMRLARLDIFRRNNDDLDSPKAKYNAALKELAIQASIIEKYEEELMKLQQELATTNQQLLQAQECSAEHFKEAIRPNEQEIQSGAGMEANGRSESQANEHDLEKFHDIIEENAMLKEIIIRLRTELSERIAFENAFSGHRNAQFISSVEQLMSSSLLEHRLEIETLKSQLDVAKKDKRARELAESTQQMEADILRARILHLESEMSERRRNSVTRDKDFVSPRILEAGKCQDGRSCRLETELYAEKLRLQAHVMGLQQDFAKAKHDDSVIFRKGNAESCKLRYEVENLRAQLAHSNAEILEQADMNLREAALADEESMMPNAEEAAHSSTPTSAAFACGDGESSHSMNENHLPTGYTSDKICDIDSVD